MCPRVTNVPRESRAQAAGWAGRELRCQVPVPAPGLGLEPNLRREDEFSPRVRSHPAGISASPGGGGGVGEGQQKKETLTFGNSTAAARRQQPAQAGGKNNLRNITLGVSSGKLRQSLPGQAQGSSELRFPAGIC